MVANDDNEGLTDLFAELEGYLAACARQGVEPAPSVVREVVRIKHHLAKRDEYRAAHPLAFATLWEPECRVCPHPLNAKPPPNGRRGQLMRWVGPNMLHECPTCGAREPRTSQRRLAEMVLAPGVHEAFVLGGNRTGKTELGAMLTWCFALGSLHPDVCAFRKLNQLDFRKLLHNPDLVWVVSQSFDMARTIQRPKLDLYAPKGDRVHRRSWEQENVAEISVTTDRGVAKIISKAFSQNASEKSGKNPFEGAAISFAWIDEECPSPKGKQSITARLIDRNGVCLETFTALTGWTEYLRENVGYLDRGVPGPEHHAIGYIYGEDNPHVSADTIRRTFAHLPEQVQIARMTGKIVAVEGAVHPDFGRHSGHIIPAQAIPPEWPRCRSIDWGSRAPFACVWLAYDASKDQIHVYHEVYQAGLLLDEQASRIWAFEGCPACQPQEFGGDDWVRWRVRIAQRLHRCDACNGTGLSEPEPALSIADPEGRDQRNMFASSWDLGTNPATKARISTFDMLFRRLHPSRTGEPGLVFHETCVETIREFEQLTWDKATKVEYATKGPDHAHDCVRYAVWEFGRTGYTQAPIDVEDGKR